MANERILFIIPPYFNVDDYGADNRSSVMPPFTIPYGMLSLHAYLKTRCAVPPEVDILDLNLPMREAVTGGDTQDILARFDRLITDRVRDFQPTMAGISALFNISFRYIQDIARVVRAESPRALILAGGGLPSAAFRQVLDLCPDVDAICKGEGEIPLRDLADAGDKAALLASHPSWITRDGVAAGKIPAHTFVQDLDEIPMLDYGILDLDDYNARSIDKRYTGEKKREMAIHTSRGCPFQCVFCSNPSLHGRQVRAMSVERVAAEVRRMKELWGLTVLLIEDDHFFFDKARAKAVLRALVEMKVRIEFPNGVAVYAIDEEVAELFSQAGVSTVALAVESGSDYVLNKIIKKPLKTGVVKEKVHMLRKHGVQSHVFIVLGLPGEMAEHRQQTLDLLLDVGFDWAHIFCAVPIFGSRLHDICVDKGYIQETNFLDHVNTKSVIRAPGVDPEEIERTAYQMNLVANFVHNHNLAAGNYEVATKYFQNVVDKYPEHAFGHQALARAHAGAGRHAAAAEERQRFEEIIARDEWWRDQSRKYGLLDDFEAEADALKVA
ncbi:MAG TPA: radical SAM protein [Thiobacillaceae bacterium]|nr:radical SAM protein [Thiobacillaceae bacterium]